jgi:hypothetical protein
MLDNQNQRLVQNFQYSQGLFFKLVVNIFDTFRFSIKSTKRRKAKQQRPTWKKIETNYPIFFQSLRQKFFNNIVSKDA